MAQMPRKNLIIEWETNSSPNIGNYTNVCIYTGPDIPAYTTFSKGLAYFCTVDYAGRPRHRIRPVYTSLCAKTNTSNRSNRGHYAYERRRRRRWFDIALYFSPGLNNPARCCLSSIRFVNPENRNPSLPRFRIPRKNTNFEINPREHPVKRNYVTRVNPEDDGERGVVSCQSVAGSIFFSMNFSRAGNKPEETAHNHIHADRYLALGEKSRHCSCSILESTRPTRRTRTLVYIYIFDCRSLALARDSG